MKCSECNCTPDECKASHTSLQCPKCEEDECCCWRTMHTKN